MSQARPRTSCEEHALASQVNAGESRGGLRICYRFCSSAWFWGRSSMLAACMAGSCSIMIFAAAANAAPQAEKTSQLDTDTAAFFESHVRPLLVAKCQSCHGEKLAEAGLRLDSQRSLLSGSDSGIVVVPGDKSRSRLLAAVRRIGELKMPPDETLSPDEISILDAWVAAGVPWSGPGGETSHESPHPPFVATAPTDGASLWDNTLKSHWAFQPTRRHTPPPLPATSAINSGDNPAPISLIDQFVMSPLAEVGLSPAAKASPRELYRRLWFDLAGLPPPADGADLFCQAIATQPERSHELFCEVADRLLESPEHAEHWARKWLDLARYADTMGYAFDNQDSRYPFAWTYRDWVVHALAKNLPYDQFVLFQLAADQIKPPLPREDLAALGFLTIGRTFLGNTHDIIDDRIDLVTRGLMGLTVSCARCHNHKYEPVSTADYYALHGIFASCEIPEVLPVIGEAAPGGEADAFQAKLQSLSTAVAEHEAAVYTRATRQAIAHAADYLYETARPAIRAADKRPPRLADGYELEQLLIDRLSRLLQKDKQDATLAASHPILGVWQAACSQPDEAIAAYLLSLLEKWDQPSDKSSSDFGNATTVNELVKTEIRSTQPNSLRSLAEAYARLVMRVAPVAADGPPETADESPDLKSLRTLFGIEGTPLVVLASEAMRVATRDEQTERRKRRQAITQHEAESPGGPIRAMLLSDAKLMDSPVLIRGNPATPGKVVERRLPQLLGGAATARDSSGRLDLAHAIVSPDNPLTARVIVNWVWLHHMGQGLVETPGDMGVRGDPPSHKELLDDLARRFVDDGKWSLRWLHREILTSRTWQQSSEIKADLFPRDPHNRLLARANRRRLDWEAWRDSLLVAAGTLDVGWDGFLPAGVSPPGMAGRGGRSVDPLAPTNMHVRSLYGRLDRQDVPGILRVFDTASPDTAVHQRPQTSVPQQSLVVLNAPLVVEAARLLAARVDKEIGDSSCDTVRIDAIWRAALSRNPAPDEQLAAYDWLATEAQIEQAENRFKTPAGTQQAADVGRWERLAHALLATAEFHYVD